MVSDKTMIKINKSIIALKVPHKPPLPVHEYRRWSEPLIKTGLGLCVMINYLTECNSANTDDPMLMCHVGDLNHSSRAKGQAQSRTLMVKPCFLIISPTTASSGLTNTHTHKHTYMHTPFCLVQLLIYVHYDERASSFTLVSDFCSVITLHKQY